MANGSTKDSTDKGEKVTGKLPISQHRDGEIPSEGMLRSVTPPPPKRVVLRSKVFTAEAATGRVSTEAMRKYLRDLRATYPLPQARDAKTMRALPGPAIAFEKWSFTESADELETEGLTMVDFAQHASAMGPASTMAFELATTGRLIHDGDPVLAEHIAATTALLTDRGMKVVPRREGPRRNHAAVAMVMAIAMAMQEPPMVRPPQPRLGVGF